MDYHEVGDVKADQEWIRAFLTRLPRGSTVGDIVELLADRVMSGTHCMPPVDLLFSM